MQTASEPRTRYDDRLRHLRTAVRAFIAEELRAGGFTPAVDSWMASWDRAFTRKVAAQEWLGMTIPREFGGHGRTFLERFVVTEELLAAGAPVAAHWFADRQIAPSLLNFGTDAQKRTLLPGIAAGEVLFAIGMSEPDAGSDLASVRTRATRQAGGWTITGSKVWTSGAHRADYLMLLARTSPAGSNKHDGLSQFILDLRVDGVEVRPIVSMNGAHHFNEVFLQEAYVPDEMVLGTPGGGWRQVTSELSFERSGPERFLSTQLLLDELLSAARRGEIPRATDLGRYVARIAALHAMSSSVAERLSLGEAADAPASMVKDLGTVLEGDIAEFAGLLTVSHEQPRLRELTEAALLARPGFTLRGGTTEVMRGVIARQLGLR